MGAEMAPRFWFLLRETPSKILVLGSEGVSDTLDIESTERGG